MGYGRQQMKDLEETINTVPCDIVVIATPVDLTRLLSINKPSILIRYRYKNNGTPTLEEELGLLWSKLE
jgi:predicted GTPase